MTQSFRLENTGLINRSKKLSFKFNGKKYYGYEGDTLASALIANGIHLVEGKKIWEGNNEEILNTDDKLINDFVYSSELFKKVKLSQKK